MEYRISLMVLLITFTLWAQSDTLEEVPCVDPGANASAREIKAYKKCVERSNPNRHEWAITPIIGAGSDLGIIFGGSTIIAKLSDERKPYKWRVLGVGSAAMKNSELTMQNHNIEYDIPQIGGTNLRLHGKIAYIEKNNLGYYGFGNDAPYIPSDDPTRYTYSSKTPEFWQNFIIDIPKAPQKMSILSGIRYRYSMLEYSPGSLLSEHIDVEEKGGVSEVPGTDNHGLLVFAAGWKWDTRNSEFDPQMGHLLQLSTRVSFGALTNTPYTFGGTTLQGRYYLPIKDELLVFATRLYGDFIYGKSAPFYEFSMAGAFPYVDMIGGYSSIRGVPEGRYRAPYKVLGSLALRSTFKHFSLGVHNFALGAAAFVDAGRVWMNDEYRYLDGSGAGIKYGVGGGLRFKWGETVVLRLDLAYSPDANPMAFYFAAGHAF